MCHMKNLQPNSHVNCAQKMTLLLKKGALFTNRKVARIFNYII